MSTEFQENFENFENSVKSSDDGEIDVKISAKHTCKWILDQFCYNIPARLTKCSPDYKMEGRGIKIRACLRGDTYGL